MLLCGFYVAGILSLQRDKITEKFISMQSVVSWCRCFHWKLTASYILCFLFNCEVNLPNLSARVAYRWSFIMKGFVPENSKLNPRLLSFCSGTEPGSCTLTIVHCTFRWQDKFLSARLFFTWTRLNKNKLLACWRCVLIHVSLAFSPGWFKEAGYDQTQLYNWKDIHISQMHIEQKTL